jgi:hypothetical protein
MCALIAESLAPSTVPPVTEPRVDTLPASISTTFAPIQMICRVEPAGFSVAAIRFATLVSAPMAIAAHSTTAPLLIFVHLQEPAYLRLQRERDLRQSRPREQGRRRPLQRGQGRPRTH